MTQHHVVLAAALSVGLTALIACDKSPRVGETQTTGAAFASMNQQAIDAIASARCEREARCDSVGVGKKHETRQGCLETVRIKTRDELGARECPGGIDQQELNECLSEIRNDNCDNPLDALGRIVACRSSDLCLH